MTETLDLKTIFATLERHTVVYVLVGALGAVAHGARLRTVDVDICPATDTANLQRIAAVLRELDAHLIREPARGLAVISMDDWATLRLNDPTEHHLFHTPYGDLDVLPQPLGAGGWGSTTTYVDLSHNAVIIQALGLRIPVAAFAVIMASKLAAGRPQDTAAADELRRVAALLARGEQPGYGLDQFVAQYM